MLPSWILPTPEPVTASPTVVDGTAYVGDWGGTFYAVPDGTRRPSATYPKLRWTLPGRRHRPRAPSVASTRRPPSTTVGTARLVVFAGGATLYVLDAATGRRRGQRLPRPAVGRPPCAAATSVGQVEVESSPTVLVAAGRACRADPRRPRRAQRPARRPHRARVARPAARASTGFALTPRWKLDPEAGVAYTGPGLLTQRLGHGPGLRGRVVLAGRRRGQGPRLLRHGLLLGRRVTSGESAWAADLATGTVRWHVPPAALVDPLRRRLRRLARTSCPAAWSASAARTAGTTRSTSSRRAPAARWRGPRPSARPATSMDDFAIGGIIGTPAVGLVHGEPAIFATTSLVHAACRSPSTTARPSTCPCSPTPAGSSSLTALRARDGKVAVAQSPSRGSPTGRPSFANGVLLVPSTFSFSLDAVRADDGLPLVDAPCSPARPSSSPVAIGDQVIIGVGTSETDLEFKAFGGGALRPVPRLLTAGPPLGCRRLLGRSPLSAPLTPRRAERVLVRAPPTATGGRREFTEGWLGGPRRGDLLRTRGPTP